MLLIFIWHRYPSNLHKLEVTIVIKKFNLVVIIIILALAYHVMFTSIIQLLSYQMFCIT